MDLGTAFACTVAREPGAVAIVDGPTRLDYATWDAAIGRVAGGLRGLGLAPGDHLVAALANCCEMATLYWACQRLGVIFTPFNWRAGVDEMAFVLSDAEAKAAVFEERSAAAMIGAAARLGPGAPPLVAVGPAMPGATAYAELAAAPPVAHPIGIDARATSLMLYTSGTTGRPKGVPRSHDAERTAAVSCIAQLGYRRHECTLGVMPLFHTMGIRALLMSMMLNGKFVCQPAFDAEGALRLVAAEKITALFLVPTMFHDMVSHRRRADHDLSSARHLGYAGASMTSALTERCVAAFAPEVFVNYYGSSEIYGFACCDHIVEKPGCAGRAVMNQELRIVRADPDARVRPDEFVGPGEAGEIIASMRSPEAFGGYWKRPDADAKAIRDGWYFTGDLGQWDSDGELYIVGRVDDMIISGGENIYPEEVEDVLARAPDVRQVAVVGLPDDRWGQKVVAFVEPGGPRAGAEALDRWCLDSGLARFKRPRGYVFVEQIPRSASGKLLRRFLRSGDYQRHPDFPSTP